MATGLVSSAEEIRVWQGAPRIVEPNLELKKTYEPLSEIYAQLYDATKDQMHKLHQLDY